MAAIDSSSHFLSKVIPNKKVYKMLDMILLQQCSSGPYFPSQSQAKSGPPDRSEITAGSVRIQLLGSNDTNDTKQRESPDPRPPSMLQLRGDPPTSFQCHGPPHSPAGSLGYDLSFCDAEWTMWASVTFPPSCPLNARIMYKKHLKTMFLILVCSIAITAVCMHMCPGHS